MSSSAHIDNKKKDILVLGKVSTQGLEHPLTAEKIYPINYTVANKKFSLSLHTMDQIVIYLLMLQKFTNLNRKTLRL